MGVVIIRRVPRRRHLDKRPCHLPFWGSGVVLAQNKPSCNLDAKLLQESVSFVVGKHHLLLSRSSKKRYSQSGEPQKTWPRTVTGSATSLSHHSQVCSRSHWLFQQIRHWFILPQMSHLSGTTATRTLAVVVPRAIAPPIALFGVTDPSFRDRFNHFRRIGSYPKRIRSRFLPDGFRVIEEALERKVRSFRLERYFHVLLL